MSDNRPLVGRYLAVAWWFDGVCLRIAHLHAAPGRKAVRA